jgi:repressor LexA
MITKRQRDLLRFISKFTEKRGYCPSYMEMQKGIGLRSKSGIHRMILGLEARRYIRRLPDMARAIEILRQPQ